MDSPCGKWLRLVCGVLLGVLAAGPLWAQSAVDADFDSSGTVDFPDFLAFAKAYGSSQARYDLDGSGTVDFPDFLAFARLYGQGTSGSPPTFRVDPETFLAALYQGHPRLMLRDADLQALKVQWEQDTALKKIVGDILQQANAALNKAPLVYQKIGPRLLAVSRDCLDRIYALGMAWRWTGDSKYLDKARENLLAVCAFPDWNPSHFLDTAEMSHAVGIGYDWFFNAFDAQTRETIRAGLIRHGLGPGTDAYAGRGPSTWWPSTEFNWNQVCNGGLIAGALAIAETDPTYARAIVPAAVASLPTAVKTYGPDGAWPEGPGYWDYATRYTAYGISALETALGADFGLKQIQGLSEAARFPIFTAGPAGLFLNYADSGEKSRRRPSGCSFYLARAYRDTFVAASEHLLVKTNAASPQHLIWYVPPPEGDVPAAALNRSFRGPVELALFRSAWNDPNALFVGVKAGYNQVGHAHLDLGNFELDALGVRWARDLGSDDYDLPGYFDTSKGARWTYYRLNSFSHSVPLLNEKGQDPRGTSKLVKFRADGPMPFAQIDLSAAYGRSAGEIVRGVALVNGGKDVLIQDEFVMAVPAFVAWAMTTDAQIEIASTDEAVLTLSGKKLKARILSPAGLPFAYESAEQPPPQKANKGVSRLVLRLYELQKTRIAILLSPMWETGRQPPLPELVPLAEW